jgi:hypothetical protein
MSSARQMDALTNNAADLSGEVRYSLCSTAGACSAFRPLLDTAGIAVISRAQIAAAETIGLASRVALLTEVAPTVDDAARLEFMELVRDRVGGVTATGRRFLHDTVRPANPGDPPIDLLVAANSALSIAFSADGRLTVGFEDSQLTQQAFGASLGAPFESNAPIFVAWGTKQFNVSRPFIRTRTVAPEPQAQAPLLASPGNTFALFRDDRPAREAVSTHPVTGVRIQAYERAFTGAVRAWAAAWGPGSWQRFIARAEGSAIQSRYGYDDTQTLAFAVCQTLQTNNRSRRGGELALRPGDVDETSRILCPGAVVWPEPPVNRIVGEIATRRGELDTATIHDIIASIIVRPTWYGSFAPPSRAGSQPIRALPATGSCSASDPEGAWLVHWSRR